MAWYIIEKFNPTLSNDAVTLSCVTIAFVLAFYRFLFIKFDSLHKI